MKQATVKLPSGEYLIVGVTNDSTGFNVFDVFRKFVYFYGKAQIHHEDELPSGNWQILGADPTNLTEEEAGEIFTYTAWLIEDLETTQWAAFGLNVPNYNQIGWTTDAFNAIKFDTQKEALSVMMKYINWDNITVIEHLFYDFLLGEAGKKLSSLAQSLGISKPYVILKNVEK